MRISDWSSDVCSSDLCSRYTRISSSSSSGVTRRRSSIVSRSLSYNSRIFRRSEHAEGAEVRFDQRLLLLAIARVHLPDLDDLAHRLHVEAVALGFEIGRASCRERVCQYV